MPKEKKQTQKARLRRGEEVILHGQESLNIYGTVRVHISGPQGSGKSLIAKILGELLPLTGVDRVVITQEQTND